MRPLSQNTRSAIERLRTSNWRTHAQVSVAEKLELLLQIGQAGEVQAVPALLDRLYVDAHRLSARPSPSQLSSLQDALAQHRQRLHPEIVQDLESILSCARRERG